MARQAWPGQVGSPRTRGDGPRHYAAYLNAVGVLPAHAGMARATLLIARLPVPVLPAHAGMARVARATALEPPSVLPAHAGMARSEPP